MNECVICKKEIKGYDVQYINGKYYHNCCIENLQFKIDKAIILIDKYLEIVDNPDINMQCVKDVLKEDK